MKKLLMLLAIVGLSTVAMAQETTSYPTLKRGYVTNGFWDNWFIDAGADHVSFYSDQEHGLDMNKNPFAPFRRSYGFDLSVGKWATPVFGLRIKGQANWGTTVAGQGIAGDESKFNNPTFNMYRVSIQPMINLCNLFAGYKHRVYDGSLYIGLGYLCNYNNEYFNNNCYSMNADLGLMNTFNVTDRFHINIDAYLSAGDNNMDGRKAPDAPRKLFQSRDIMFGLSAGLGVNLGKVGWDNAPDVDAIMAMNQAQLDALNAALADQEAENARLKALIANHKCPEGGKTVKEFAALPANVFFNLNSAKIASKKDLVDVKGLVEYAKANGKKIVLTGSADSNTGSTSRNQTLSEQRCKAVADEIVAMGFDRNNIETVAQGGVNNIDPYTYNRRVIVSLK